MIHVYFGSGKGKTTAAMGLALRMAGRGREVVIAQFLKGADSGERYALSALPSVTLLEIPGQVKFSFALTAQERLDEQQRNLSLLKQAQMLAARPTCGLLVLDEVCGALETGLLPLSPLLACLDHTQAEIVLTGRMPPPELLEKADYATHFEKVRHPFDRGVSARPGIEF